MTRAKTSSHHGYVKPLLIAMHNLSGGMADVKVRNTVASKETCRILGVEPDAFGNKESSGLPYTFEWTSRAMLENRAAGLMTFPVKGWWVLTPAGVAEAKMLLGLQPIVEEAKAVIAEAEAVVAKPTKVKADPEVEVLDYIPQTIDEAVDAYFLQLQMAATPCFGNWSPKSDACKGCSLASRCYSGMLAKLAELADGLPLVEEPKQTIPWSTPATATPAVPTEGASSKPVVSPAMAALDPSVFTTSTAKEAAKVADQLPTDSTPPTAFKAGYVEMEVVAEAKCIRCQGAIAKGEKAAYTRKTGFAHIGCANSAAGVAR